MNLWKIDIQQKLVPDSTEPELVFQAAYNAQNTWLKLKG